LTGQNVHLISALRLSTKERLWHIDFLRFSSFRPGGSIVFETLHKSKQISVIALDRLGDYIELLRIELKLQGRELVLQVVGYVVAAFFGVLATVFLGIAIILSFWNSEYLAVAAWFVVALYLAAAGAGVYLSRKHLYKGSAFSTLRTELKRDVDLVKEAI
jgi:uncharacterized membrane protein YqjE